MGGVEGVWDLLRVVLARTSRFRRVKVTIRADRDSDSVTQTRTLGLGLGLTFLYAKVTRVAPRDSYKAMGSWRVCCWQGIPV